jgi:hypothetical protein
MKILLLESYFLRIGILSLTLTLKGSGATQTKFAYANSRIKGERNYVFLSPFGIVFI